jgi:hypothetical protein
MLSGIMLNAIMLSIIMLSVTMLSVIMLNVIMLSVIILSVIMLSVVIHSVSIQSVVAPSRLQQLLAMTIVIKLLQCKLRYLGAISYSVLSRLFANRVKPFKVEHHSAVVCWLG